MRILHILDHSIPLHSGYTFRSASILREQRNLGWETFHITSEKHVNCSVSSEVVDGLDFFRTPKYTGIISRISVLNPVAVMSGLRTRLLEVASQVKPDILHAHSPLLNGFPALSVGKTLGIPVVYETRAFWEDAAADHGTTTEGSLRYRSTRALETMVYRRADAITVICEGLRSDIENRGIAGSKITVIPNAVDIEKFPIGSPPDRELQLKLGLTESRVIGFIGSFYAYEGLDLLLKALPQILSAMPDVQLLLVGGGPQETALKSLAKEMNVEQRVIFTGRVPHEKVNKYYDLIEVLVYPRHSMRLTELVTPLKPLEAMAQGQLFVASDVGGHKELIIDGTTGVLFKAGSTTDLANKVVRLLSDRASWASLKSAGRKFVEIERNWRVSIARYPRVYEAAKASFLSKEKR
jgi:glycogen synthase